MSATSLPVISRHLDPPARPKLTCRTCKLKKCVGRCRWETLPAGK